MLGYNNTKYFVYSLIYKIVCHLYFTRKGKYYSKLSVFWGRKTKIQTTLKVMHNMLKPETKLNEFDYTYIHDLNRIVQRPSSNSSTFNTESTWKCGSSLAFGFTLHFCSPRHFNFKTAIWLFVVLAKKK